jgi:hypothetical protein
MGVGGKHGAIMTAFLDLLDPRKWNQQYNILENFIYDAVQKRILEEVSETRNKENNPIKTLAPHPSIL